MNKKIRYIIILTAICLSSFSVSAQQEVQLISEKSSYDPSDYILGAAYELAAPVLSAGATTAIVKTALSQTQHLPGVNCIFGVCHLINLLDATEQMAALYTGHKPFLAQINAYYNPLNWASTFVGSLMEANKNVLLSQSAFKDEFEKGRDAVKPYVKISNGIRAGYSLWNLWNIGIYFAREWNNKVEKEELAIEESKMRTDLTKCCEQESQSLLSTLTQAKESQMRVDFINSYEKEKHSLLRTFIENKESKMRADLTRFYEQERKPILSDFTQIRESQVRVDFIDYYEKERQSFLETLTPVYEESARFSIIKEEERAFNVLRKRSPQVLVQEWFVYFEKQLLELRWRARGFNNIEVEYPCCSFKYISEEDYGRPLEVERKYIITSYSGFLGWLKSKAFRQWSGYYTRNDFIKGAHGKINQAVQELKKKQSDFIKELESLRSKINDSVVIQPSQKVIFENQISDLQKTINDMCNRHFSDLDSKSSELNDYYFNVEYRYEDY